MSDESARTGNDCMDDDDEDGAVSPTQRCFPQVHFLGKSPKSAPKCAKESQIVSKPAYLNDVNTQSQDGDSTSQQSHGSGSTSQQSHDRGSTLQKDSLPRMCTYSEGSKSSPTAGECSTQDMSTHLGASTSANRKRLSMRQKLRTWAGANRKRHVSSQNANNSDDDKVVALKSNKKPPLWVHLLMTFRKRQNDRSNEIADVNASCVCTGYKKRLDNQSAHSRSSNLCNGATVGITEQESNKGKPDALSEIDHDDDEVRIAPYPAVNPSTSTQLDQDTNGKRESVASSIHSQVDYVHRLVPDMWQIACCSFYWGVMDRYEAEKLLENKPEGTFLLRDSAQDDFLFSVSFRRYGRSLHARIEQWNNEFSFDIRDRESFSSSSVRGLIDHYKLPSSCLFFEPMLCIPLNRKSVFSLQHLSRARLCPMVSYDSINTLPLPKSLKSYLKEYHYKQKVRVKRLDDNEEDDEDDNGTVAIAAATTTTTTAAVVDVGASAAIAEERNNF